ncbi:family 78 glycoside hydrolase catalytic domain [Actinoplanes missouriensis]|uniref:family 78 glycoside hydrolase catalytic domain n=1 Tax=Actinoplanes missouriensis TaxID=1866 RepID=UPI0033E1A4CA
MSTINPFANLRTSGLEHQLLAEPFPEFSWAFAPGVEAPDAAEVEVCESGSGAVLWRGTWRRGTVPALTYAGPRLRPSTAYTWRVGSRTDGLDRWSPFMNFETHPGFLEELADWIGLPVEETEDEPTPVQYLRRSFQLEEAPVRARLYCSAQGWYGAAVNGDDVTGVRITPRFTAYDQRLEYEAFDITHTLVRGANTVGLELAEGRYRGRNGAFAQRNTYGLQIAAIAHLVIEFTSGRKEIISTDSAWTGGYGPRRLADPQEGVIIDARIPGARFTAGDSLIDERPVTVFEPGTVRVEPMRSEPVVTAEILEPVSVTTIGEHTVIDFGQNLVGVARLTVSGAAGTTVEVHHSELIDEAGHVREDYLSGDGIIPPSLAIDRFVLAGGASEVFEPRYTMRGFRYIEVESTAAVDILRAEALVLHADLRYGGSFDSSHPGLNRLHQNVVWSMRGNFTDIPTDCPTRERTGWTGDAQVFTPTATLLADVDLFLRDWLRDVVLLQTEDGAVKDTAPRDANPTPDTEQFAALMPTGSAGWADAITIIPWALYESYGRGDALTENWDAMVAWIQFCVRRAAVRHPSRTGDPLPHEKYIIDTGFHWGEWLEPGNSLSDAPLAEGEMPHAVKMLINLATNPDAEVATAYFARSADLLSRIAAVLGRTREEHEYSQLHAQIRAAYQTEFLDADGVPHTLTQAKLVRPLTFGLIPDGSGQRVADRLAELIVAEGSRLGTGFLSTGFLLPTLSAWGHDDLALDVLLQEQQPSWLGQVALGATTTLETWNGVGSQNHYAYGSVARYLYENLAGMRALAPGWQMIEIRPLLTHRFEHIAAETMTPFGPLSSAWRRTQDGWAIDVSVPAGTEAVLVLDGAASLADGSRRTVLPCGSSSWAVTSVPVEATAVNL